MNKKNYIVYLREWYAYNRFGQFCKMPMDVYTEIFSDNVEDWQKTIEQSNEKIKSYVMFHNEQLISETELITDEYKSTSTYFYYDNEADADKTYQELYDYAEEINNEPYYLRT